MMSDHKLRRYTMFLAGVLISAVGIAFVTRAGLGTSPISGVPFILSLVTAPSMGVYTFLFNSFYVGVEVILRKKFTWMQALQIVISVVFSLCIDTAMDLIPSKFGEAWMYSFIYLLIGCFIMALGIAFEVMADVIMLPAEAVVRAISQKIGTSFGNTKVAFDTLLTLIAVVLAFCWFGKLNGVREGTIINALLVGQLVKMYRKVLNGMRKKWLKQDE